jgi:hypothetical protein
VILTIYCNICWQYHDFAACVLPWYEGWTSDVIFCGINFTLTLLITFVTEWLVALSTSSKIFWFCVLIMIHIFKSFFKNFVGYPCLFIRMPLKWKMLGIYPLLFECTRMCSITKN